MFLIPFDSGAACGGIVMTGDLWGSGILNKDLYLKASRVWASSTLFILFNLHVCNAKSPHFAPTDFSLYGEFYPTSPPRVAIAVNVCILSQHAVIVPSCHA